MDSQNDQSLQKLTRYMTSCDREFYRALETLRRVQADRRARDGENDDWEDEPEDEDGGGEGGGEPEASQAPEPNMADAAAATPAGDASRPMDQGGAARATRQEGEEMSARSNATRGKPGSRADSPSAGETREPPRRWDHLTPREQTLFVARNSQRVLAVDDLLFEAASNPYRLQRLGPRQLLHQFEALNRVVGRTMRGLDEILKEEDTTKGGASTGAVGH